MRPSTLAPSHALLLMLSSLMLSFGAGCNTSEPEPAPLPRGPALAGLQGQTVGAPSIPEGHRGPNDLLRHTVFFKFKESSSPEDVQSVVDAFRVLPEKIDAIKEFEWGVNDSPEGLDDGFTHCFRLSFADEAGREEYLPHPAHSGDFADVLRPHMEDVFVIDYDGQKTDAAGPEQLRHYVFIKFKEDTTEDQKNEVISGFADLRASIDTIRGFEWGVNNSPEKHDDGFTHAFCLTFTTDEGRKKYLEHEEHVAFAERLKPIVEAVRVLDYWIEP